MAHTKLTPEVQDVLTRSTIGPDLLTLPDEQLPRDLYLSVAKVIGLAGGKWNRSRRGFVFPKDPRDALNGALDSGTMRDRKKERQAFYAPPEIAATVARLADVDGRRVLEPSAGEGALASACETEGAAAVDCVEIEPECLPQLAAPGRVVVVADFLALQPFARYERIVMNPPFAGRTYAKHVEHAKRWLAPGGRLFAIVPDNGHDLPDTEIARRFPAGSFKHAGTDVATRLVWYEAPDEAEAEPEPEPEPPDPADYPPPVTDRDELIAHIRTQLKRRTGRPWSVTGGRGTAWGWIRIDAPPRRRTMHAVKVDPNGGNAPENWRMEDTGEPGGSMTDDDRRTLAEALGLPRPVHHQGESIPAGNDYRTEYFDRAAGRPPRTTGEPYWD